MGVKNPGANLGGIGTIAAEFKEDGPGDRSYETCQCTDFTFAE